MLRFRFCGVCVATGRWEEACPTRVKDCASLFAELLGKGVSPERLADNLAAYQVILSEIQKLRELDLSDVQPAVIFDVASLFGIGQP